MMTSPWVCRTRRGRTRRELSSSKSERRNISVWNGRQTRDRR